MSATASVRDAKPAADAKVKVSVIVPVYNPGTHIDELIASILRQSLPTDEYEAIFVDDGSTDGTGERLDALAAEHANITAIHIPNSGWPGRPRNVGLDASTGKYVYFVDNDDWIGDDALERLYERAERNDADVVVGKEIGHGKGVPRHLSRRNNDDAKLLEAPLLDLLTPHKLFRRVFLDEQGIRFPEGRRRLEDHVFVMNAFFKARRISILADYPGYHWIKREDATNATDLYADPGPYYENVREILDIVDAHTEPGLARDRFHAHWYRSKGLHRMRGPGWAGPNTPHVRQIYAEVRRLALERFGPGVAGSLPTKFRVLSRSVMEDRPDLIRSQATLEQGLKAEPTLASIEWADGRLRLDLAATLTYADGTPLAVSAETTVCTGHRRHCLAAIPTSSMRTSMSRTSCLVRGWRSSSDIAAASPNTTRWLRRQQLLMQMAKAS